MKNKTAATETDSNLDSVSYNEMFNQITTIISDIENEQIEFDQIITKVKHAHNLLTTMQKRLTNTKDVIEKLTQDLQSSTQDDNE